MSVTIPAATLLLCFIFQRSRITLIFPYALLASQVVAWLDWWVLTFLLFVFYTYDEVKKSVEI